MRILLVEDHPLVREGIKHILDAQPDMHVVAEASTIAEAIALAGEVQPDLVLMDFALPDGTGVDATRAILQTRPQTRIVFLTLLEDDQTLFAAIRSGAKGYLNKTVPTSEFLDHIRGVERGEAAISAAMAGRILAEFARLTPQRADQDEMAQKLTSREMEVLRELATGASNRAVAARLVISESTVKTHVSSILDKLHLKNRRQAALYARRHFANTVDTSQV